VKRLGDVLLTHILPTRPVFTTREVADLAGSSMAVVSRHLGVLARRGVLTRITRGIWAQPRHPDFSPYAAVPLILAGGRRPRSRRQSGYISLLSALSLRGLISQIPRILSVVATKWLPILRTPIGIYEFHQLEARLIGGFEPFGQLGNLDVATAEKALFDTIYFSTRKGRRFSNLPEIELPRTFRVREVEMWIARIRYGRLRSAVAQRWRILLDRVRPASRRSTMHLA